MNIFKRQSKIYSHRGNNDKNTSEEEDEEEVSVVSKTESIILKLRNRFLSGSNKESKV
jgi:hypothetical protein